MRRRSLVSLIRVSLREARRVAETRNAIYLSPASWSLQGISWSAYECAVEHAPARLFCSGFSLVKLMSIDLTSGMPSNSSACEQLCWSAAVKCLTPI
jgi:hypothetical protein